MLGLSRFKISTHKVGLPPGQAVFTGERRVEAAKISWIRYRSDFVERGDSPTVADIPLPDPDGADVLWVNVDGLHDVELVKAVGAKFGMHPLSIEDVVSVSGRPVAEAFEKQVFTTIKMLTL